MKTASERSPGVKFVKLSPDQLKFDPRNPRLGGALSARATQEQLQQLLEREPHLALQLVPSFLENGFIDYEPLVAKKQGKSYLLVEGNRRLAAIRHILAHREEYSGKSTRIPDLESIPVLLFAEESSPQQQQEERVYLGVRHLFGFREWPAESKARYLDSQVKTPADIDRLLRELNVKKQDLQRYLVPFRLRKLARDLWADYKDQDFWVLGEGLSRSGIKAYLELEVDRGSLQISSFSRDHLEHLLRFIYGAPGETRSNRVIKETRDLSKLAELLKHKKAARALEKGTTLSEAAALVESIDDSAKRLKQLLREVRVILSRLREQSGAVELRKAFDSFESAAQQVIKNVR